MAVYATYVFYDTVYQGTAIAEANFDHLAIMASAVIDQVTFDRTAAIVNADEDAALINKIGMATCAVAEKIQSLESSGPAVQSERVGNYSVTYLAPKSSEQQLNMTAKLYLGGTGLMYPGFSSGEYGGITVE